MINEEIVDDVLHDLDHGNITRGEAKAKILAAISAEGEVVLGWMADIRFGSDHHGDYTMVNGKRGTLIFRPEREE